MGTLLSFLRTLVRWTGYELIRLPRSEARTARHAKGFVGAIAATPGMISLDEASLLNRLACSELDGCIVEIGSYRGRSTVALALGHDRPVYAIEPHESFTGVLGGEFGPKDRAEFYRTMLRTGCWRNVRLVNLPSDVAVVGWREKVGLLWIDGDHRYEAVRRDWKAWEGHLSTSAVVIFDDCEPADLGPALLVGELQAIGWKPIHSVGKVVALSRARKVAHGSG